MRKRAKGYALAYKWSVSMFLCAIQHYMILYYIILYDIMLSYITLYSKSECVGRNEKKGPDVLGGEENSEGKRIEKISRGQKP